MLHTLFGHHSVPSSPRAAAFGAVVVRKEMIDQKLKYSLVGMNRFGYGWQSAKAGT